MSVTQEKAAHAESVRASEHDGRLSPYCPTCGSEFACNCEEDAKEEAVTTEEKAAQPLCICVDHPRYGVEVNPMCPLHGDPDADKPDNSAEFFVPARELISKWRASAAKAEAGIDGSEMDDENETHMRDMRMCADQLEAILLHEAVYWNPYNKVVQDHRDGTIYEAATNVERAKRGLPVPWKAEFGAVECRQAPSY